MNANESITKYMATKLITFKPENDIWVALKVIVKNKISGAPVVNSEGILVGMLSEVDCIRVILEGHYNNQPGGLGFVKDFMSADVNTLEVDCTLIDAAYAFAHSKFRRFPVLDKGKLVGQLSRSDILKAISRFRPDKKVVPDSWKPRIPILNPSKRGRHSENA